jgi:hypothetical protein
VQAHRGKELLEPDSTAPAQACRKVVSSTLVDGFLTACALIFPAARDAKNAMHCFY